MSISGNESTILWFRGSVLLVLIPPLPPGPAPPPLPPPAHPQDLLRRLQVPLCPTEHIRDGGKETADRAGGEKRSPTHCPHGKGAPHRLPMPQPGGDRDVTPPPHPPKVPNSHSLPTAAHEVAQHHAEHRSHRQRHQQRHQERGQQILGGGRGGGLEIPAPLQHPGTPHRPRCRGGGQHLQLERRGRSPSGTARGWGVGGGRGAALTRVRLHQRMAKWGAKVS